MMGKYYGNTQRLVLVIVNLYPCIAFVYSTPLNFFFIYLADLKNQGILVLFNFNTVKKFCKEMKKMLQCFATI